MSTVKVSYTCRDCGEQERNGVYQPKQPYTLKCGKCGSGIHVSPLDWIPL